MGRTAGPAHQPGSENEKAALERGLFFLPAAV